MDNYTNNIFVHHNNKSRIIISNDKITVEENQTTYFHLKYIFGLVEFKVYNWNYVIEFDYYSDFQSLNPDFTRIRLLFDDRDRCEEVADEIDKRLKLMYPKQF